MDTLGQITSGVDSGYKLIWSSVLAQCPGELGGAYKLDLTIYRKVLG